MQSRQFLPRVSGSINLSKIEGPEELRRAIGLGYDDAEHLTKDTDLDRLRSHPGFDGLIEGIR